MHAERAPEAPSWTPRTREGHSARTSFVRCMQQTKGARGARGGGVTVRTLHPHVSVNLVPLLLTGVRHHPPGRTDKNLCRCFGADPTTLL